MTCDRCTAAGSAFYFECVACCVRWLSGMDRATMAINAPVIEAVTGKEHMELVRTAWKARHAAIH
jgi:hypothetical protein